MAKVELDWRGLRDDTLPRNCICCGVPADYRHSRTFRWMPWWQPLLAVFLGVLLLPVGLIPILGRVFYREMLSRLATPREMQMRVSLCSLHESHWRRGAILGCGS